MGNIGKRQAKIQMEMATQRQPIAVSDMYNHIGSIPNITKNANPEAMEVINLVRQQPNATITIYKATSGNTINKGDFVFLDKRHADRWTRGAMGGTKPGFKVVEKQVSAGEVEWTRRGFEFRYR